ncbi:hypothetical protein [Candidatus Oscillochloris fontis]|nr:hypothetical protein [Candidatus Oscillochloris fontis]
MEQEDIRRRLIQGVLNLVLGLAATWLATYITNKILGAPDEPQLLG